MVTTPQNREPGPAGDEDFATLFEQSRQVQGTIAGEGEIVTGKVIDITRDMVIVDFGHKSEGQVPIDELTAPNGELTVKIGDTIDVYLENIECEDGLAVLSKEKADALRIWDRLQEVLDKDGVIEGVIVNKVKGGLSVDIGVKAFLPASQIDVRLPGNLDKMVGRRFKFKILKLNKRKGNIIVSRRALMERDRDYARQEILQNLSEGQTVTGTVKNITDYGAFIDLGGVDGLLHITDMTWGRVGHPSEILSVGQDITIKVLKIDPETGKVSLGLKQLTPDPWDKVAQKYAVGSRAKGRVISVTDYGAFVELEQGIEGLVHISEMSWSRKIKHPSKVVNVGDIVETVILDVDPTARRISLGMKQVSQNPWEMISEKYPVGTKIRGPVKNVTDFGLFVGLTEEIDGLVHISDVAWIKPARPLAQAFPKKTEVEALVLAIDSDNERISLGLKQLTDDCWPRIQKQYAIGTRHAGKIVWGGEKGLAVELEPAVEGFIAHSDLPEEFRENPAARFPVGENLEVVVHSLDERDRKILLGLVLEGGAEPAAKEKKRAKK
jgi:small subunit ribosomal protein S1